MAMMALTNRSRSSIKCCTNGCSVPASSSSWVVSSTVLFFIGVAFCYYFVFGQVFAFIQSFAPKSITAAPDIEAYLSFVLSMFLAFGLAFEVPIAVVVLGI